MKSREWRKWGFRLVRLFEQDFRFSIRNVEKYEGFLGERYRLMLFFHYFVLVVWTKKEAINE